jgi:MFS transporter, DHA3 family, macrolide efflux protein
MWKNKNVWIILMGEFVAGLGLWLGIIGNLEFMQEKVPSDFLKSLILAVGLLAGLLLGPLAGRVTDHVDKKKVMLISGFGRAVSVLFMFAAIHTDSILWMVVFMIFIQVSTAFYFPALQAAIPMVVHERELLQLNGVHMNMATLSRILGTALAGVLLVVISLSMLYFLSLAAYLVLFFLTFFLHLEEPEQGEIKKGKAKSGGFKDVFPVIKGLPIVMMTLIMTLIPLLFLGGFNLLVINISELQDSSAIKGWIYTFEGISFMLGAFFVRQISGKRSPYVILFLFSFVMGLAQMLLFFADHALLAVSAFAVFGFAVGCFFPTAATIFQTRIPKEFHGRFFSFRNMMDRLIFQVVLLMTGLFLDLMGLQHMTLMFGIISLSATALFYMKYRQLKGTVLAEKAG